MKKVCRQTENEPSDVISQHITTATAKAYAFTMNSSLLRISIVKPIALL